MDPVYFVAALVLVVVGAVGLAVGAAAAMAWARRLLDLAPVPAAVGLTLTGVAALNTLVARGCHTEPVGATVPTPTSARPLLAVILEGGGCFRTGVSQVAIVVVLAVGTSVVVHLAASRNHGAGRRLRPG